MLENPAKLACMREHLYYVRLCYYSVAPPRMHFPAFIPKFGKAGSLQGPADEGVVKVFAPWQLPCTVMVVSYRWKLQFLSRDSASQLC